MCSELPADAIKLFGKGSYLELELTVLNFELMDALIFIYVGRDILSLGLGTFVSAICRDDLTCGWIDLAYESALGAGAFLFLVIIRF